MEGSSSLLDELPNEILFKILFFLDVTSRLCFGMVCKRFYCVISDPIMWSQIVWKRSSKFVDESCLKRALKLSRNGLKNLSLSCWGRPFLFSKVALQVEVCRCLNTVTLNNVKLTSLHIKVLLKLPQLLELYLGPETHASLIFKEIRDISTNLKVFGFVESGNYYRSLLRDWSTANYTPFLVKVLLWHHPNKILEVIKEIESIIPSSFPFPGDNNADLCIYQLIHNLGSGSWDPIIHLQYTSSSKVITCSKKQNKVFNDALVLCEKNFNSGVNSIATYYPDCKVGRLDVDLENEKIVSLNILGHHIFDSAQLDGIARSFPNLTSLDLKLRNDSTLDGLINITLQCSSLRRISLDVVGSSENVLCNELWESLSKLSNLVSLRLSCNLIPSRSVPVLFSSLKVLHITRGRASQLRFIDRLFKQFTKMPVLKSFIFQCIPSISVFSGFSEFLNSVKLEHLFVEKLSGNKLTFPLDSSCYRSLNKLCIRCLDFIFSDELAAAICECENLSIFVLDIWSIQVRSIKALFDSLVNVVVFHVHVSSRSTFRSNKVAKALTKSFVDIAKLQNRNVDIILTQQLDSLQINYSDVWY